MTVLISAIVSTYNAASLLSGCLHDLQQQSIADQIEVLIIDSGSIENEALIVGAFQNCFPNIRYLRTQTRESVYTAWNRGVRMARGIYITNANTDDRHRKDAFERMSMVLDERPEVALVYADVIKTETENETFEHCTPTGRYRWCDWDRNLLLSKGCFIGPQPMWRRSVHDLFGFFDETLVTSGDYEFWLRISQASEFYHLRETLGLYLESPGSIEHRSRELKQLENAKIVSQYGRAAREGKIIRLKPLEELESVLWSGFCNSNQKLKTILEDIETLGGLKNTDPTSQHLSSAALARNYFDSKNRVFQGDKSAGAIDAILQASSKLILSRTRWFAMLNRESVENSTGIEPGSVKGPCGTHPGGNEMSTVERIYEAMQPVMRTGRTADAISALRNITSAFPDFARAHNDLASLLFQAGQRQEALSHYEIAAAAAPENPDFQKMLGDIYYVESARVEDALRLYGKALALRPGDVQTRMTVGNILVGLQRFEEAEMHYRKVLEVDPQHGEAATVLRKLEDRRGERTVETGSAETIYFRAKRMAESGDMEGASRILQRLVNLHPGFGLAHNDLAVLIYRMGDKEKALSHYEAAVRLEPGNIIFQKNLGDFYYVEQKRIKDALKVYVKVLEIEPEEIETLLALGNICRETQQNEDAVVFFERVLEIEPWNQAARASLDALEPQAVQEIQTINLQDLHAEAVRLASFGDESGSLKLLEQLVETCPDFALAHNDLGVLAYQAGDKDKALEHYESAVRLAPQHATFSKNLADCYWVGFGRTEDALKVYVDILKTHPEEIDTLIATGKLCQAVGQPEDARVFFERVLEIEPANAEARTQLDQVAVASQAA